MKTLIGKVSMHPELREQLRSRMRMLGWKVGDFWMHSGLSETVPRNVVARVLRGEPEREDVVYAVEWCAQGVMEKMEKGELIGDAGIKYLKLPHVEGELHGKELKVRLFFSSEEEIDAVRDEICVLARFMNFEP